MRVRVNPVWFLILCFVHRASLYNLVNRTNLVHNLFLVYLSVSICFRRLCAHHQEKQLCYATLGTCYSVWMPVWYARAYSVWMTVWYAGAYAPAYQKHVQTDKYTKNKLCTKLALFTRLYRDARSTKHKKN